MVTLDGSVRRPRSRRRIALRAGLAAALVGGVLTPVVQSATAEDKPHVLVWGGAYGFRHPSITAGELAFLELGQESGDFTVEVTENPADLTASKLANVDVLAWISTTGKPPLTQQQRDDVIRWAYCGGGTMAFHAAADSNYGWAEHAELLGAQFDSHPKGAGSGEARMLVEDDRHPITAGWKGKKSFMLDDEYYRWRATKGFADISLPRSLSDTKVLLSLDETTVDKEIQDGPLAYEHHQPIAWTKTFRGGGRVYYNNMGHSDSTWSMPEFRTAIVNGVDWVSEKRPDAGCLSSSKPIPGPKRAPAPDPKKVGKPCTVPATTARSGGTWETSAPAKRLTAKGDRVALASGIPGNLGWGGQAYILDLSGTKAKTADVTVDLSWPAPVDDYDLSVTTAWGWYGSQAGHGDTTEQLVLKNVPHCAALQMYGDNLYGVTGEGPTLAVAVRPLATPAKR